MNTSIVSLNLPTLPPAVRARILVIDDESGIRELLSRELSVQGYSVQTASNGLEGLETIAREKFQVVLCDLNMPKMGGKECLTQIKKDEHLHKIPVIMYTTSSQSKDIEETMQKGAICFITEPTNIKELNNILASIAGSVHNNLEKTLRNLSNTINTFMVC